MGLIVEGLNCLWARLSIGWIVQGQIVQHKIVWGWIVQGQIDCADKIVWGWIVQDRIVWGWIVQDKIVWGWIVQDKIVWAWLYLYRLFAFYQCFRPWQYAARRHKYSRRGKYNQNFQKSAGTKI